MLTLDFDQYQTLSEFREAILQATACGQLSIIISDSEVLFTAVSPELTKELIAKKVANRLAESPDILADLHRRLKEEEPESWND